VRHIFHVDTPYFSFKRGTTLTFYFNILIQHYNMLSVFRNKRSLLLAPVFRGVARRARNPTLDAGGKGGLQGLRVRLQLKALGWGFGLGPRAGA